MPVHARVASRTMRARRFVAPALFDVTGTRGMAVRYFMNPHLGGRARDDAQAQVVQLRLV